MFQTTSTTDLRIGFFDIETPPIPSSGSFTIDKIWCIGVAINDGPVRVFTRGPMKGSAGSLRQAMFLLNSCDMIVSFNGIGFDAPIMERIIGMPFTTPHLDLFILGSLIFTSDELFAVDRKLMPDDKKLWGSQSLKAFGKRIGKSQKIEFEDFSFLTPDMMHYLVGDVEVTRDIYNHFVQLEQVPPRNVIELEHQVATIIQQQTENGFHFDIDKARKLATTMMKEYKAIHRRLISDFKAKQFKVGNSPNQGKVKYTKTPIPSINRKLQANPVLPRFKNGKLRLPAKKKYKFHAVPTIIILVKSLIGITMKQFNPGSRDHIKRWLKEDLNFEFTTYTAKGSQKVDGKELAVLGDKGKDLVRYLKLTKDLSQLLTTDNSLIQMYNTSTNSIHGRVNTLGAATHRCTHSNPNLAQIPAGGYFRELFNSPSDWVLVGADLANIEIRVLAHYLAPYDGGKYVETVLSKDMHFYHAKLAGFWTLDDREWPDDEHASERTPEMIHARKLSKAFFFSFMYGSGDTVRGNTLWYEGCLPDYTEEEYTLAKSRIQKRLVTMDGMELFPLKKDKYIRYTDELILQTIFGKRIADTFKKNLTGFDELTADCQKQSKKKGTVTAIDGRELFSRSPHSALNLLLQGSAGVIGKQWMINYHQLAADYGLIPLIDWKQYAYIHDEYQCGAHKDKAATLIKALEEGASMITEQFSMNIQIKADGTYGKSWADTH